MSQSTASARPSLGSTDILFRAGLAALLAFVAGRLIVHGLFSAGWHLPSGRVGLASSWAARMLAIPAAFAATWWRLKPRLSDSGPPPALPIQLGALAGIALVLWAVFSAGRALLCMATGWLLPDDLAWSVAALGFLVLWRRSRPFSAGRKPRRPPVLWRVPFAIAVAALYAAPFLLIDHVMSAALPWVSHVAIPLAVLMAWVAFGAVVRGEPLGRRRSATGTVVFVEAAALLFGLFVD